MGPMKAKNSLKARIPSLFGFSSDELSTSSDEISLSLNSLAMKPCLNTPGSRVAEIVLLINHEPIRISLEDKDVTAEDACTSVAAAIGITPLYRHLFFLQVAETKEWLPLHVGLQSLPTNVFTFRLRLKASSLSRLKELDKKAFDYYYFQVRHDLLANNIRNLSYEKDEAVVLGLVVTDMFRTIIEEDLKVADIESRFKTFMPKNVLKNHFFNNHLKNRIIEQLHITVDSFRHDVLFAKEEYLMHVEHNFKEYLVEEYEARIEDRKVNVLVDPYHSEMPGLRVIDTATDEVTHLGMIEDLCFISIRDDGTVELFRKNGIPINFQFFSLNKMNSFVSLLDSYYRLSVKWTFNLCKEIYTPSLSKLHRFKCHGPVGGQFSYAKLQDKRDNKPGCYILRECESCHDTLYLDVCLSNTTKPKTYRIQVYPNGNCLFSFDETTHSSLPELLSTYRNSKHTLQLLECIPPTESDKSQVLICSKEKWASQLTAVTNPEEVLLSSAPQCINLQTLQLFPGSRYESRFGITVHYRGMWKNTKHSRVKVVVKELKSDLKEKHLSEFLELAGRWCCLQTSGLVKLYGVTLAGRVCMVSEFLDLGPLDAYLSHNPDLEIVDLIEAASSLAMALYQMEEACLTHGNIRCRKVMVSSRSSNKFVVKLCDPGVFTYNNDDIPRIPPECHQNRSGSKMLMTSDVWAFGTTLWEIFSKSKPLGYDSAYFLSGKRLPMPANCPRDIYTVMRECWETDASKRKRPHAIMRDIYHILYQVFNCRRGTHNYETAYVKLDSSEDTESESGGSGSVRSDTTFETVVAADHTVDNLIYMNSSEGDNLSDVSLDSGGGGKIIIFPQAPYSMLQPEIGTNMPLNLRPTFEHIREEAIYQLGWNCNVVFQGSVGKGNYGEVFRGLLERTDHLPQQVAVKRLTRNALSTALVDFKREIDIMQKLQHPNIVKIIGEIPGELSLVMEFVSRGCLQGYLAISKHVLKPYHLLKFAEDVAKGMEYLGKKKIVHRDLAARNILVANENLVKISDFGLAQFVDTSQGDYYMLRTFREVPIKWYAPESLARGLFSPRSDVWSYGVTLFEMFTFGEDPQLEGCPEQESVEAQYACLQRKMRLPCPELECGPEVYRCLMLPCWQFESQARPTFSDIITGIAKLRTDTNYFSRENAEIK